MADWTVSQWIFLPLWFISNAVVALGVISMLLYMAYIFLHGLRQPVADIKANTPKQRT